MPYDYIFIPACGSVVGVAIGVGAGLSVVGLAGAAAFSGVGVEADGLAAGAGSALLAPGSGALEAIGIGSLASIASIIAPSLVWSDLTFWAAVRTRPVAPLARTTSESATAPR